MRVECKLLKFWEEINHSSSTSMHHYVNYRFFWENFHSYWHLQYNTIQSIKHQTLCRLSLWYLKNLARSFVEDILMMLCNKCVNWTKNVGRDRLKVFLQDFFFLHYGGSCKVTAQMVHLLLILKKFYTLVGCFSTTIRSAEESCHRTGAACKVL